MPLNGCELVGYLKPWLAISEQKRNVRKKAAKRNVAEEPRPQTLSRALRSTTLQKHARPTFHNLFIKVWSGPPSTFYGSTP